MSDFFKKIFFCPSSTTYFHSILPSQLSKLTLAPWWIEDNDFRKMSHTFTEIIDFPPPCLSLLINSFLINSAASGGCRGAADDTSTINRPILLLLLIALIRFESVRKNGFLTMWTRPRQPWCIMSCSVQTESHVSADDALIYDRRLDWSNSWLEGLGRFRGIGWREGKGQIIWMGSPEQDNWGMRETEETESQWN